MLKKVSYKDILELSVFFKDIFHESFSPQLVVRPDNLHILECNDAALRMLGFAKNDLLKKYIYDIHPVKLLPKIKKQYENFSEKEHFSFDMPVICHNKEKIQAVITFKRILIKGTPLFAVAIYDLSERLELEKSIKDENQVLLLKTKDLLNINRNLIASYENLKKKFKEFRLMQKQEILNEKKAVIMEISEIVKEKINTPLIKILEDIDKIKGSDGSLSKESHKRMKMMEEIIENMLTTMSRISEERDIQKMRYVDLENIDNV
jgi:PAS domain S-box-containing protein